MHVMLFRQANDTNFVLSRPHVFRMEYSNLEYSIELSVCSVAARSEWPDDRYFFSFIPQQK